MAEALGLYDVGYEGYAGFELCHPFSIVNWQSVGIDFVDKNAELATGLTHPEAKESRSRSVGFVWVT